MAWSPRALSAPPKPKTRLTAGCFDFVDVGITLAEVGPQPRVSA